MQLVELVNEVCIVFLEDITTLHSNLSLLTRPILSSLTLTIHKNVSLIAGPIGTS